MKGYKKYFNGKRYIVEDTLSDIEELPNDSTTSWFRTYKQALIAADLDNQIEAEQKNVKVCKECGSYFYQTERDRKWFIERNLKVPCRCITCRKNKKKK